MKNPSVYDLADRCGKTLAQSRTSAGFSRKAMGMLLGISESTVKAWEDGQSSPTLFEMIKWLNLTGYSYFKYLLDFCWPDVFAAPSSKQSDGKSFDSLISYIMQVAGESEIEKIHFLTFGNHGAQWSALLDLTCAFISLDLNGRYLAGDIIQSAYDIAKATGTANPFRYSCCDIDHDMLKRAIAAAKAAQFAGKAGYSLCDICQIDESTIPKMLEAVRIKSGLKRKDLAKALGKTERTIQNWESVHCPPLIEMVLYLNAANQSVWSFIQCVMNSYDISSYGTLEKTHREEICSFLQSADKSTVAKMLFLINGAHGTNWPAVLESVFEYVCLPLPQRIIIAKNAFLAYQAKNRLNKLSQLENNLPDIANLERCINSAIKAAKLGKNSY